MNEEQIEAVAAILTRWNPLGEAAKAVADLNGYRTEAIDIIAALGFRGSSTPPEKTVADVINQGFGLAVKTQNCVEPAREILSILSLES